LGIPVFKTFPQFKSLLEGQNILAFSDGHNLSMRSCMDKRDLKLSQRCY